MRNGSLKLFYLGLAILVIAACGGGGSGDNSISRVIPLNLINDGPTGVIFHVNSVIASVQAHFQHGNSVQLTYPSGSTTQTVNATITDGTGNTLGTSSTTVGVNETINNIDVTWSGAFVTLTKE